MPLLDGGLGTRDDRPTRARRRRGPGGPPAGPDGGGHRQADRGRRACSDSDANGYPDAGVVVTGNYGSLYAYDGDGDW